MADVDYSDELCALGRASGLDAVGIAPATPFQRTLADLESRKAAGLHAGMAFTYRNPRRSTDPGEALLGAKAIVVGAKSYLEATPDVAGLTAGRVARYAWRDHYAELRGALDIVAQRLRGDGWQTRVLIDDNGLVDREAAYRAGLGWYGKNANLLLPGRGSWFVLGSVVTDAPLVTSSEAAADGCGGCRRCIDACPTGAIVSPGVVDANRCLAWLVQQAGTFPVAYREALGDRIYGCDDCQEVCPINIRRATPASAHTDAEPWVSLVELLALTDDEILSTHGRWYIPARQPRWVRRNALVALGNVGDGSDRAVVETLVAAISSDDSMLRAHAVWAAGRLGRHDLLACLVDDTDDDVRAELVALQRAGAGLTT